MLIDRGADVDKANEIGQTALFFVAGVSIGNSAALMSFFLLCFFLYFLFHDPLQNLVNVKTVRSQRCGVTFD